MKEDEEDPEGNYFLYGLVMAVCLLICTFILVGAMEIYLVPTIN